MKKTLITLMVLAGAAVAADTQYVDFSGKGTIEAGATFGAITLEEAMSYGSPTGWNGQFGKTPDVNITGGNFFAGDYTLSLWVKTASLSTTGNTLLFAYSGSTSSNTHGYNGIVWDGANKTLTIGRGDFTANNMQIAWAGTDYSTSNALTFQGDMVNFTIAVSGKSGSQTATIYVNGTESGTLASYNGNMNGGNASTQMGYYVNNNLQYGTIGLTNEKLGSSEEVIAFAIPEPATATLSLLTLAGLAARRRRK